MVKPKTSDKIVGYIYETYDYDKFVHLDGNREDALRRKNKVGRSIEKIGYIKSAPVIVDPSFKIGDGQARFEYRKEKGQPVYYAIEDKFDRQACIEMNISQSGWRLIDYIRSYAEDGDESYLMLEQLLNEFPKFKAQEISGISDNVIVLNGYASTSLKNKEFTMSEEAYTRTRETLRYLVPLLNQLSVIPGQQRAIRTSIAWMINNTDCDRKRVKQIISTKATLFNPISESAICRFLEQFSQLYNKSIGVNKQIDFDSKYKEFVRYSKKHEVTP